MSSTGAVSSIDKLPDRERTASRLLAASAKTSFDPRVDLDWDAPLAPDRFYMPPHRSSLYGTYLWERLTEAQRIELTKHELASLYSAGILFESALMQMLLRHAYDQEHISAQVQWTLTEIADECRHSMMFARLITKLGTPAYSAHPVVHALAKFYKTISNGPMTYTGTLCVEEILDALQREAMADESLQPLVRGVSRIHVVEEARHIRFADEEGVRQGQALGRLARAWSRFWIAGVVYFTTSHAISPAVYAAVGLDPEEARRVARSNPHWRATWAWSARKATAHCHEQDLIGWPGTAFWNRLGLLDVLEDPPAPGPMRMVSKPLDALERVPVVAGPVRSLRRRLDPLEALDRLIS